ncbi:MAG TPA: SAM-dependent methyltransferase [Trebonia sp.]|nr:SAM-dependent methyltransferase [Trebonia sp.]
MTDELAEGRTEDPGLPVHIDTTRPHQARVYDYWLGGKDNFAVDREAAERALTAYPGLRRGVRAQRAFLANAVGYLTSTAGVRQFLDIGTGIPTANNTHEVAHAADPDARVVYVDNDPVVLAHARALLIGSRAGTTSYLDADLRDTGKILTEAAAHLDFSQPIGVLLIGILQLIPDEDDPRGIVARLMEAVPPGSWLAIFHPASDILADQIREVARQVSVRAATPTTLRAKTEITRFFDGLDLLEPGLVQVHRWRPGSPAPDMGDDVPGYAGLARKP